jgi:hypothetical protein
VTVIFFACRVGFNVEEAGHKLMNIQLAPGQVSSACHVVLSRVRVNCWQELPLLAKLKAAQALFHSARLRLVP